MLDAFKGIRVIRDTALRFKRDGVKTQKLVQACKQLLSERGVASGVSQA